jgi:hypothetical protein
VLLVLSAPKMWHQHRQAGHIDGFDRHPLPCAQLGRQCWDVLEIAERLERDQRVYRLAMPEAQRQCRPPKATCGGRFLGGDSGLLFGCERHWRLVIRTGQLARDTGDCVLRMRRKAARGGERA